MTVTRCDIVIAPGDRVFINGTEVGRVTDLDVHKQGRQPTELVLTMEPDSIIYGDIPKETIHALVNADDDYQDHVNIDRAIQKAKARQNGIPLQAAPVPVPPAPKPVRATTRAERAEAVEAMPMDDAPSDTCHAGMGGGQVCSRPYGHGGVHR